MVKKIGLFIITMLCVFAYLKRHEINRFLKRNEQSSNTKVVKLLFRTPPNLEELTTILFENGIIESEKNFKQFVFNEEKIDTLFAAGKFIILPQTNLSTLINGFRQNEFGHGNAEVKVNVLFNRCTDISDVGKNISKCIVADSASLVSYILSPTILQKYGFTREQMPALFIPGQYEMYFDTDPEQFVEFMANEFKQFWTDERMKKMKEIGINSPSQAVTLASIVYSEQSRIAEEWPIIAKLYLNRLKKGMKLQSDPTFKFCWEDRLEGVERLLNVHKSIDCPYNTYLYVGLPPGPICLPPYGVVDAVLNPSNVNYLYLCGKPGGGGHNFASSLSEHERNVVEYRKWLKSYLKNKQST